MSAAINEALALAEIAIKSETAEGPLADALRSFSRALAIVEAYNPTRLPAGTFPNPQPTTLQAAVDYNAERGGPYFFNADALVSTAPAVPQWARPGSAPLTELNAPGGLQPGIVVARPQTLTNMAFSFTGDNAINDPSSTTTARLYLNGALVPNATVTLSAHSSSRLSGSNAVPFSVAVVPGDLLQMDIVTTTPAGTVTLRSIYGTVE